jgi:hypothetical protein
MATTGGSTTSPDRRATGQNRLERVTVNLNPRASRDLEELVELTRDTKTDSINRAVQIYAYLERILHNGGAVYVREKDDAELERLKIF